MIRMLGLFTMLLCTSACVSVLPSQFVAGDFDGSKPMLCTVIEASECIAGEGCQAVTPEEINLPRFLWINVEKKTIQSTKSAEDARVSRIEGVKRFDSKLILQGAEDGREGVRDGFGWSLAVMEDTGQVVLTASGDRFAVVAFGTCTLY
jgi:hypothetical protein